MERKALLTLTLGAILFLAHPAHAQFVGDRMRIETENGEKLIGRVKRQQIGTETTRVWH